MNNKYKTLIYYSVFVLSVLIGASGIYKLILKPDLPFKYSAQRDKIACENQYGGIDSGSYVETIDGVHVGSEFELEFFLDSRSIGQTVAIGSVKNNEISESNVILVPYYQDLSFIIVSSIIGAAFLLCALFVFWKKPDDPSARVLFWILLLFGLATLTSPGKYTPGFDIQAIVVRLAHDVSYIIGTAAFMHFSLVFPRRRVYAAKLMIFFYSILILLSVVVSYTTVHTMLHQHDTILDYYELTWRVTQSVLAFSIILGLANFILSKRKINVKSESSKLNWILWGITVGVAPYIFLFNVPTVMGWPLPVPEGFSLLFLLFIPFSFAAAVVKHHIFDIEIIINRSIVYAVLTAFVLALYFSIVAVATLIIRDLLGGSTELISVITAFTIAVLFNPARARIQRIVDVTLYREKYNFESSIKDYTQKITGCPTVTVLGKTALDEISSLIPVDRSAVILLEAGGERSRVVAENNFEQLSKNIGALRIRQIKADFTIPFALEEKVQHGLRTDNSMVEVLKRWDINLVVPLSLAPGESIGAFVLGNKLSGLKYSLKDLELLGVLASETAIALKRLQLQEELIIKEIEYQKLEELNSLQSFFVSSVTHDLKTPLTSIKMFTEMMKTQEITSPRKKLEYLSIIEGESDRLAQLIDNVLTYSKIESGALHYDFQVYGLNELVAEALELMKYQFSINKFNVETDFCKDRIMISADKSTILSVLVNLLTNAVKYSDQTRQIKITTGRKGDYGFVTIEDKGIGIPEKDLPKIFEPFYRADTGSLGKAKGTGLGLAIVKHSIVRHMGKIEVSSKIGEGTIFRLLFPSRKYQTNT